MLTKTAIGEAAIVYLASKSPRRKALLEGLGYSVCVLADPATPLGYIPGDEEMLGGELPANYVERTACEKILGGLAKKAALPAAAAGPVLAADTVVSFGGEVLGKPRDAEEAKAFLRRLSGSVHEVRTAVVASDGQRQELLTSLSLVEFKPLSEEEISAYVATGEPFDKAGGYGIQGLGGVFIRRIEGSYTGIMGLPVYETALVLSRLGAPVPALAG